MPYGGGYSYLSYKINRLNRYNFIKNSKKGAILIEFAFAVPVLFSLIYYIQDLARLKYLQGKMDFATMELAGILQNISQSRSNKAITAMDVRYAVATALLSWCPGKTLFPSLTNAFFMGCAPMCTLYYFYGTDTNKASCKWVFSTSLVDWSSNNSGYTPSTIKCDALKKWEERSVDCDQSECSKIYPSFTIKAGEYKLIIETFVWYHKSLGRKMDGTINTSPRDSLGFYVITPKYYYHNHCYPSYGNTDANAIGFFNSVVIITPKPGLFSETPPE